MNLRPPKTLVPRFGIRNFKKKFIQQANRRSKLNGTIGSFNRWCRSQGLAKNGKVTMKCINRARHSKSLKLRRRANFAKNIKAFVGAKHSRFGNNEVYFGKAKTLKEKYTSKSGRKSPGVSATLFPVGTIKKGLDKKNWVIVQTSKGVKRWQRIKSPRSSKFGNDTLNKDKIIELNKIEKNIHIIEQTLEKYPDNDTKTKTLKGKSYSILRKLKTKIGEIFTLQNAKSLMISITSVARITSDLFNSLKAVDSAYTGLYKSSGVFRGVVKPVERILESNVRIAYDKAGKEGWGGSSSTSSPYAGLGLYDDGLLYDEGLYNKPLTPAANRWHGAVHKIRGNVKNK